MSDLVNRRAVYGAAAIAAASWAFIMFTIIQPQNFALVAVCMVVAGTCHSFMYGPQAAYVIEQFHPRVRYTGASLAYTIAGVFGGALAPLMFTLVAGPEGDWVPVAIYVTVACVLTLIGLAMGRNSVPAEDLEYLDQGAAAEGTPAER